MAVTSETEPVRAQLRQSFDESRSLAERAQELIPGGGHNAKGPEQFPDHMPGIMERGLGCHVWDVDGNEFIEYGMGLRAVTLGHALLPILEATQRALPMGTNFTRPARIEIECAEKFLSIIQWADMVKFCKDGSDDSTGRAAGAVPTPVATASPFAATTRSSRPPTGSSARPACRAESRRPRASWQVKFSYNDIDSLRALFAQYPVRSPASSWSRRERRSRGRTPCRRSRRSATTTARCCCLTR